MLLMGYTLGTLGPQSKTLLSDYVFSDITPSLQSLVLMSQESFSGEIYGSGSDDTLRGTALDDVIAGGGGNDRIYGLDGDDLLLGGGGYDIIYGGEGQDEVIGGSGNDSLHGGDEDDYLDGGDGNDFLYGGLGGDDITGGAGFDTLSFGLASEGVSLSLLAGGYSGEAKNDTYDMGTYFTSIERVIGTSFDDIIIGDLGDNILVGGGGNDYLQGGGGTSWFIDGDDVMIGGAGTDSYGFYANIGGRDIIHGFTSDELIYMLSDEPLFDSYEKIMSYARDFGPNVIFDFIPTSPGQRTLTLTGVNITDLSEENFDFSRVEPADFALTEENTAFSAQMDIFDMDALI